MLHGPSDLETIHGLKRGVETIHCPKKGGRNYTFLGKNRVEIQKISKKLNFFLRNGQIWSKIGVEILHLLKNGVETRHRLKKGGRNYTFCSQNKGSKHDMG